MKTAKAAEYRVFLMLSISDYQDGENIFIEGEMILKRKCFFFFDIEKVTFYEGGEGERFLKDFLGIEL